MADSNAGIGSRLKHRDYGSGVVINLKAGSYVITFMDYGKKEILKDSDLIEFTDVVEPDIDLVSLYDIERSLTNILKKYCDYPEEVELGKKWIGGTMILKPGDKGLSSKEIPIEQLFHKIVMIRDRMRTLEQRVNASAMTDEEKVSCQQYITRCYGSLTTFNVLFRYEHEAFVGDKGKE